MRNISTYTALLSLFIANSIYHNLAFSFPASTHKWHPGHYYAVTAAKKNDNTFMTNTVYSELQSTPALRGVQLRYTWAELEGAAGVYNFNSIQARLAELLPMKKRLVLQIQIKSFAGGSSLVPNYITSAASNPIYGGGVFSYSTTSSSTTSNGEIVKLWNNNVRDRLILLMRALGAQFNSHENLEAIVISDTSYNYSLVPITPAEIASFYENLAIVSKEAKLAFPNTVTLQEASYPTPQVNTLVTSLVSNNVGIATPNTLPDDPELNSAGNIYSLLASRSKIVPLATTVSMSDYLNTKSDHTGHVPTINELIRFTKTNLKANYIFWMRSGSVTNANAIDVLSELNLPLYKDNTIGVGELLANCPSKFIGCSSPVKWHPGHYYFATSPDNTWYMDQIVSELTSGTQPAKFRGIKIRLFWSQIETTKDNYSAGFALIDSILARLRPINKKLILRFQQRSFELSEVLIPSYLNTFEYGFGQFGYSGNTDGNNVKLFNANVVARLKKLMTVLGERYNGDPNFEAIGMAEATVGLNTGLEPPEISAQYTNLMEIDRHIKKSFPNTINFQFTNHPESWLPFFTNSLLVMGSALGGPDTFINDTELNNGVYSYYPDLNGKIPLMPSVQPDNYKRKCFKKNICSELNPPTVRELYLFARDTLRANYLLWSRTDGYYPAVLNLLRNDTTIQGDVTGAGGLDTNCPREYISCLRN